MDVFEVRRANLRELIRKHGGTIALAAKIGYTSGSFLSQVAGKKPSKELSEKAARHIEEKLGLLTGCLDAPEFPVAFDNSAPDDMSHVSPLDQARMQMAAGRLRNELAHNHSAKELGIEIPWDTPSSATVSVASKVAMYLLESVSRSDTMLSPSAFAQLFTLAYKTACRHGVLDSEGIDDLVAAVGTLQKQNGGTT